MGSSSSKDSRPRSTTERPPHAAVSPQARAAEYRGISDVYSMRLAHAHPRGGRQELPLLIARSGGRDRGNSGSAAAAAAATVAAAAARDERPRETKQEREARKAEKERQLRLKERERSMREEGVDGGYLVTLGVYTGPEDFSKGIVRQLQIERRLAPFWKGLNDHSESWAEHQLVAAVRGLPIPAADEIPPEMARTVSQTSANPRGSDLNVNSLTIPISSRSQSYESSTSANLSASHPAFSSTLGSGASATAQLLRGRAKTLASLATGSKSQSPDLTPREIRLPQDPYVNGSPIEAHLYKDASECPICFMYYPPYLNKTRCCDQPICSECFVQIKRPDPHPPEHEQPGQQRPPEEEAQTLVSEVAACPFCVTPEFGVSYDPPPFRRGLAYANQNASTSNPLRNPTSAMSSSSSLTSTGGGTGRRRATSLSANAPQVITTDRVRPDWAKKLADARAHALRRSAAATALHNAAYVLGTQEAQLRSGLPGFGRRRRTLLGEAAGESGSATPQGEDSTDLYPERGSSRRPRTRVDDLEELMMMEAIRLSLAAEEERKRKEEKEVRKEAKRRDKEAKKEAKYAKRNAPGSSGGLYPSGANDSTSTWASANMARSTSNLGSPPVIPEESVQGKGKAPVQDVAKSSASPEPPITPPAAGSSNTALQDPQRHLEESRAHLQPSAASPIPTPSRASHIRQVSYTSSANSSFVDSAPSSLHAEAQFSSGSAGASSSHLTGGMPSPAAEVDDEDDTMIASEPMLNFHSLTAAVTHEEKVGSTADHHENSLLPSAEAEGSHEGSNGDLIPPAEAGASSLNHPEKAGNPDAAENTSETSSPSPAPAPAHSLPVVGAEESPAAKESTSAGDESAEQNGESKES